MEDRPSAIVASTLVEDSIQDLVLTGMKKLSGPEYGYLFLGNGPLTTFAAKIRIANALKLLSTDWAKQIELIKDIRNVFAHARFNVDFETPEILEHTKKITVIEQHRDPDFEFIFRKSNHPIHQIASSVRLHEPRSRFIGSCLYFASYIWDIPPNTDDWIEDDEED